MSMITNNKPAVLVPKRIEGREETQNQGKGEFSERQHPIVGIPIPVHHRTQGPLLLADAAGAWALERMQARVFLIPVWPVPTHEHVYQSLWPLMHLMDGLFLPASVQTTDGSLHQQAHEQPSESELWSISWEIALAQLVSSLGMPVLAVADGAEKWNSALGGTKGDGVKDHTHTVPIPPEKWERHSIRVRTPSTLASSLQPAIAKQDGKQHPWDLAFPPGSGVEKVAPGLLSCAQSEDGTVVAFERRDDAFGLGILGRLDWGLDQTYAASVFAAFLDACGSFDHRRRQIPDWEMFGETICATLSQRVREGESLLSIPLTIHQKKRQQAPPLSTSPVFSRGPTGDLERVRQRSPLPTKEDLNRMRRQRLNHEADTNGYKNEHTIRNGDR